MTSPAEQWTREDKELGILFKSGVLVQPKVSGPWQLRKKSNCEFEAGLGNTATSPKMKIK